MAICTVDSPFFVPSVSCDLVRSPTRSHETEGTKKGESTSLRSSSPMVTLSLGLEPVGCTNEAYIVRLDSMEPGNGVCCGATRVFGAYVTDFLLILCAPKRLYIPLASTSNGSTNDYAKETLRVLSRLGMLSTVLVCDAADSKRQHLAVPGPFVGGLRSPNVMAPHNVTQRRASWCISSVIWPAHGIPDSQLQRSTGAWANPLMSRCISTATSVLTDLM